MSTLTSTDSAVVAPLGYIRPQSDRPYDYACPPPPETPWHNYQSDARPMRISDARERGTAPSLGTEGFELIEQASAVTDFHDESAIRTLYYAEVGEIARSALGGSHAYVFDHLVREREAGSALTFGRQVTGARPSANGRVHNDYTEASGPRRMLQVLGEQARRYAIVNIWRPLRGPVLDAPLALCDAASVAASDLVASDVHYATRSGEIYLVTHSPRHRWFYFSEMHPGETLLFKQFDSDAGSGARFVPHAAFDHPHTPADAPLRRSIEARVLVVFD